MTTTVKTVAQVRNDIAQVRREIADCERSLPAIVGRSDLEALYAAQDSLGTRQSALQALLDYLPIAEEHERVQAEQDKKRALERERDDATVRHAELDTDFEKEMADGERYILDLLDRLDPIALQRQKAEAERADATFELRGRQVDWSRTGELSSGWGWFSAATEGARSPIRQALFELYAARHRLYGKLQLPGQDNGLGGLSTAQPPQQLTQPDNRVTDAMNFIDERMSNGD